MRRSVLARRIRRRCWTWRCPLIRSKVWIVRYIAALHDLIAGGQIIENQTSSMGHFNRKQYLRFHDPWLLDSLASYDSLANLLSPALHACYSSWNDIIECFEDFQSASWRLCSARYRNPTSSTCNYASLWLPALREQPNRNGRLLIVDLT